MTGAVLGSSNASDEPKGRFANWTMVSITYGDAVLVVERNSESQTAIARELIADSVGEFKDLNMLAPIATP